MYKEFIDNIIQTRGLWNKNITEGYCERHHILPKCLGGLPETLNWEQHSNVIWLTAQEHFIAHKLLAKENPTNHKLVCAYQQMCYSNHNDFIVSPEDYETARVLFSKTQSKHLKGKKLKHHIIHNPEAYSKQKSEQCSGTNNPMYGKGYKLLGSKNGRYGKLTSEETKKLISEKRYAYIYLYDNKAFKGVYALLKFLNAYNYPKISQMAIEACIKGGSDSKLSVKYKYPDLNLNISKITKEEFDENLIYYKDYIVV